jgi:hypothetical protein
MVGTSSYKLSSFRKWRLLDGQELETSFVDASTGSDVEDPCEEEDKGGEHRQDVEANRGRDAAKGVQSRIITRFSGLTLSRQQASRRYGRLKAPQCAELFPF